MFSPVIMVSRFRRVKVLNSLCTMADQPPMKGPSDADARIATLMQASVAEIALDV